MGFDLVKAQTLMESWFPNGKSMLNEDQYSTKQGRRAISYMKQRGYTDPDKQKQIIDALMHDLEIHRSSDPRFNYLVGCTRLYLDKQVTNVDDINRLKTVLKYVSDEGHQGQYDENLNNLSLVELTQIFQKLQAQDAEKSRSEVDSLGYGAESQNGYRIVKIDTDEQAREYGGYTSWCITHGSFSKYKLDDVNQCYFCLKDGFENIMKPQDTSNAPFDEFGLSMVSVIVGYDGEPTHITTRYNHEFNGENNPGLCTAEQVSRLIGVNFYQVFQPNEKGLEIQRRFRDAQANLDNGMSPEEVFDDIYYFEDGFAAVEMNDKVNFIDTKGRIINDTWFDFVWEFKNGFAKVQLNDKYNFIDIKCRIINDIWLDEVYTFRNGFAAVKLNEKYNYINTERRIISDIWFDYAYYFNEGFAGVKLNDKWNYIDTECRLLSDTWFDRVDDFVDGFAMVRLNDEWYYIDTEGNLYDENRQPIQIGESKIDRIIRNVLNEMKNI